jgi:hypothetical protein
LIQLDRGGTRRRRSRERDSRANCYRHGGRFGLGDSLRGLRRGLDRGDQFLYRSRIKNDRRDEVGPDERAEEDLVHGTEDHALGTDGDSINGSPVRRAGIGENKRITGPTNTAVPDRDLGDENLEAVFRTAPNSDFGVGEVVTCRGFVGEANDKRKCL